MRPLILADSPVWLARPTPLRRDQIPSLSSHLVVMTTLGDEATARTFIEELVEDRVVACGTMVGATSIFRWKGSVTDEQEVLVLLKTQRARWADLEAAVKRRHPYSVPELLALPVEAGLDAYLNWVDQETTATGTTL